MNRTVFGFHRNMVSQKPDNSDWQFGLGMHNFRALLRQGDSQSPARRSTPIWLSSIRLGERIKARSTKSASSATDFGSQKFFVKKTSRQHAPNLSLKIGSRNMFGEKVAIAARGNKDLLIENPCSESGVEIVGVSFKMPKLVKVSLTAAENSGESASPRWKTKELKGSLCVRQWLTRKSDAYLHRKMLIITESVDCGQLPLSFRYDKTSARPFFEAWIKFGRLNFRNRETWQSWWQENAILYEIPPSVVRRRILPSNNVTVFTQEFVRLLGLMKDKSKESEEAVSDYLIQGENSDWGKKCLLTSPNALTLFRNFFEDKRKAAQADLESTRLNNI